MNLPLLARAARTWQFARAARVVLGLLLLLAALLMLDPLRPQRGAYIALAALCAAGAAAISDALVDVAAGWIHTVLKGPRA